MSSRSRHIMFTVFADGESELLQLDPSTWPHCRFAVWQMELCPETNRPHFQGYAEFDQPMTHVALHRYEGLETAHFEPRRGTAKQAKEYCRKENTRIDGPWEWGEESQQGARTDLIALKDAVKRGASEREIAEDFFSDYIRYNRGIKAYKTLIATPRDQQPTITLWIGPSGVGKTRAAREKAGENSYWKAPGKWWDGYDGQTLVVLDEFHGDWFPFRDLLRILDSSPLKVETKGGMAEFQGTTFYITSNQHPKDWYNPEKVGPWEQSPLKRRLDEFGHYEMEQFVLPRRLDYGAPQNDFPFDLGQIDLNPEGLPDLLQ